MVNGGFGSNFQEEAGSPKIPLKKDTAVLVASLYPDLSNTMV